MNKRCTHTIGIIIYLLYLIFFFQAEDSIRDLTVTGVQTCALPICGHRSPGHAADQPPIDPRRHPLSLDAAPKRMTVPFELFVEIGRASCRKECRYHRPPYH